MSIDRYALVGLAEAKTFGLIVITFERFVNGRQNGSSAGKYRRRREVEENKTLLFRERSKNGCSGRENSRHNDEHQVCPPEAIQCGLIGV